MCRISHRLIGIKQILLILQKIRTMGRNSRKDIRYEKAFTLFLQHQYDGVSLSDIEKATNMTRGAIFYYHTSKLDLFKAVMKYYFINRQKVQTEIPFEGISLKDFIDRYVEAIGQQMETLRRVVGETGATTASKAYIILGLKLREYSEELNSEYTAIRNQIMANWVSALQNAEKTGEIKPQKDIQTLASLFVCTYFGLSIWESFQSGLDIEHLRHKFMYLYDMIKTDSGSPD